MNKLNRVAYRTKTENSHSLGPLPSKYDDSVGHDSQVLLESGSTDPMELRCGYEEVIEEFGGGQVELEFMQRTKSCFFPEVR